MSLDGYRRALNVTGPGGVGAGTTTVAGGAAGGWMGTT